MNTTDRPRNPSIDLDRIRDLIEQSPYADRLLDDNRRRAKLYKVLSDHKDPIFREIGTQLRDGVIRPHDVLTASVYREHIFKRFEENQKSFVDSLMDGQRYLEEKAEEAKRERDR